MSGEFPEYPRTYWVCETFTLAGGGRLTDFAAGPFEFPDHARQARDRIRDTEPAKCVHCIEYVDLTRGAV